MSQAIEKRCRVCGKDVASQKRTKDATGNYYCQPCYLASAERPRAEDAQDVDFAALERLAATPSTKTTNTPDLFTCPRCEGMFSFAKMDTSGVCKSCSARSSTAPKRQHLGQSTRPAANKRQTSNRSKLVIGLLVTVIAVGIGVGVIAMNNARQIAEDRRKDEEQERRAAANQRRLDSQTTVEPTPSSPTPAEVTTLLASLPEARIDCWTDPAGRMVFHKSVSDWDGSPIAVNGVVSKNGLFTHPRPNGAGSVSYSLNGEAHRFVTTVGIADSSDPEPQSSITFEVVGDGKVLWSSSPLSRRGQSQACDIDVTGVQRLDLVAKASASHYFAHAVWVEPRIIGNQLKSDQPDSNRAVAAARLKLDEATLNTLSEAWLTFTEGIDGEVSADAEIAKYKRMGMKQSQLAPMYEVKKQMIEMRQHALATLSRFSPEARRIAADAVLEATTVSDAAKAAMREILGER